MINRYTSKLKFESKSATSAGFPISDKFWDGKWDKVHEETIYCACLFSGERSLD